MNSIHKLHICEAADAKPLPGRHAVTPFYYYDTELLDLTLTAAAEAAAAIPDSHIHYAVKANANPRLLDIIARAGFGADCVSGGEVEAALRAGFPAEKIVFAGVGKADWELELAVQAGIRCFNVESLPELEVLNEICRRLGRVADVCFRVNPNVDAHTHEKITTGLNENKFGIALADLIPAIRQAQACQSVRYAGLHFHIGSQILDAAPFAALAQRINEIQLQLEAEGIRTDIINVGGGLGIDYAHPADHPVPDFTGYFQTFAAGLQLREGQQFHCELGRSLVAQCGTLVARVLYVKQGHAKQFLILDAGFTELIRPAMYGALHAIENLTSSATEQAAYDVVGPICESSDVFAKAYSLPLSRRGDLIALRSAGAYGEVMASTYNCRPLPPAVFSADC